MKIRNGFVSNSSSSSFIVALEKKPQSKEEVRQIFFKDKKFVSNDYKSLHVEQAVDLLWEQLQAQSPLTKERAVELVKAAASFLNMPNLAVIQERFNQAYRDFVKTYHYSPFTEQAFQEHPEEQKHILKLKKEADKQYQELKQERARQLVNTFWDNFPNFEKYCFTFRSEGIESVMENGDAFYFVPTLHLSYH